MKGGNQRIHVKKLKGSQASTHSADAELVKEYVERYADLIGLDESWRFEISFKSIKGEVLATCVAEWHYKKAYLEFDLARINSKLDGGDGLEAVVRHEMLHIPCWRLHELVQEFLAEHTDFVSKYEEELVTFLECMPVWQIVNQMVDKRLNDET